MVELHFHYETVSLKFIHRCIKRQWNISKWWDFCLDCGIMDNFFFLFHLFVFPNHCKYEHSEWIHDKRFWKALTGLWLKIVPFARPGQYESKVLVLEGGLDYQGSSAYLWQPGVSDQMTFLHSSCGLIIFKPLHQVSLMAQTQTALRHEKSAWPFCSLCIDCLTTVLPPSPQLPPNRSNGEEEKQRSNQNNAYALKF